MDKISGSCEDMDKISGLSEELLVKILSFLSTKEAVSTSILSRQWEFLWMWAPKLDYHITQFESDQSAFRKFINKNLPLHRAPIIERFSLELHSGSVQRDDIKLWARILVSRCVRELSINCISYEEGPYLVLPSSLYTCKSLVTLTLCGEKVFVDVPGMVSLPSLKTLKLLGVLYSKEDSLRLLLSCCPVLEDLVIERYQYDNLTALIVTVPSLQRLSLQIYRKCPHGECNIVTPSLKYLKVYDRRDGFSYLIEPMPKLEEADINVTDAGKLLQSITSLKRLSLCAFFNIGEETVQPLYPVGIVFNQLEHLELRIDDYHWQKSLFRLLEDSPKLQDLSIYAYVNFFVDSSVGWKNYSIPNCLLESLESFKFGRYQGTPGEKEFLSIIFKNARCLKYKSIYE